MPVRLKLMPKLLVLFLVVAVIPLIILEIDTQSQMRILLEQQQIMSTTDTMAAFENLVLRQQVGFGLTIIIALALSAITAIALGRSIVRPINHLQASARRLLSGEFPTFDLPGTAADELADLADALREMSTGLHALVIEAELHRKDVEKLYEEANRRAAALETIRGVSQRISTILDINDLLHEIVELIRVGFNYDRVHLFTADYAVGELVFRAGAGQAGRVGAEIGERIPIGPESILGQVVTSEKPMLVQDFEREPRYRFSPATEPASYIPPAETRSELVVPLSSGGQVIGVLSVQSNYPGTFKDEDSFVLQELANQAAGAIVNAELYEEAYNHAQEIMALLITTVAVTTAPDLGSRLEAIAHHARQLMNAEGCLVFRLDSRTDMLYPLISLDPTSEQTSSRGIPVGEGITGRVVQTGQGEIGNYGVDEPQLQARGLFKDPECILAVPLLVGDHTIGAMTVHRKGTHKFASHDLELLTMFASQAAVAIENAELYQQLTERAETLQRAYKELEEVDQIKDEMIQNISHELRTPLTFIIGYLCLILEGDFGALNQQQKDSMELVYRKAQSLNHMVDNIITLQTIRISQPELVSVDIVGLVYRAVEIAQPAAKQANIHLAAETPSEMMLVKGEPARLAQIFDNLLNNAIKFSPDGGTIIVRASETANNEITIQVQDTGIGIPPDKLEKVFDRFYQVDGTATRRFGGVGMGLHICREIIKAHGGQIWVESPTCGDHGSTFYFTLQRI
jgi:signal transduction histidine kinase